MQVEPLSAAEAAELEAMIADGATGAPSPSPASAPATPTWRAR